jgi:hypothetical protein
MAKNRKMAAAVTAAHDDWETEDDLRTLARAEEIQKDSKRMSRVTAMAKKKMLAMASIASEGAEGDD